MTRRGVTFGHALQLRTATVDVYVTCSKTDVESGHSFHRVPSKRDATIGPSASRLVTSIDERY
jgi:hypothetical protein